MRAREFPRAKQREKWRDNSDFAKLNFTLTLLKRLFVPLSVGLSFYLSSRSSAAAADDDFRLFFFFSLVYTRERSF